RDATVTGVQTCALPIYRVLRLERDVPQGDLDLAARYINDNFRGWLMEKIRAEIGRRIEQERSEYDRLMKSVEMLYRQGALASDRSEESRVGHGGRRRRG